MQNLNQTSHLSVWRYVMEKVHENLQVKDFDKPEGIDEASTCKITGKLANSFCPVVTEYYEAGTAPTDYCTGHNGYYSSSTDTANIPQVTTDNTATDNTSSYNQLEDETAEDNTSNEDAENGSYDDTSQIYDDGGYSDSDTTGTDGTSSIFDIPAPDAGDIYYEDNSGASDASDGFE
jgi:penicillin-binding protein 1A